MKLTPAIQEALVAMLLLDGSKEGHVMVSSLVPTNCYDPYFRDMAEAATAYFSQYGQVPGEHAVDLIDMLKATQPDRAKIFDRLFHSIQATGTELNRRYIIDQASMFARHQRLKQCVTQSIDLLERGDEASITEAEALMQAAGKSSVSLFDAGTFLHDGEKALAFLDEANEAFPTGIPQFDMLSLGPVRGGLHLFMGSKNAGKTWWLTHLGKQALLSGMKVAHITLEMSEPEIAMRYLMSLFSITTRKANIIRQEFESDELGRFIDMHQLMIDDRPSLKDSKTYKFLRKRISWLKTRAPLIIKQFPTGMLTMRDLRAYLDGLEAKHNFIPDLLIVDYVDLMSVSRDNFRIDLGYLVRNLRGLMIERNMAGATVTQANREAETARWVTSRHVAEDYSKLGTVDTLITYSQTKFEYQLGLARLLVEKSRRDTKNLALLISQAYAMGQFCLDSTKMVDTYWRHIDEEAKAARGDDDDEDDL